MAGSKRIVRMRAEEITGTAAHLLTADGEKGAIYAVAGIVVIPYRRLSVRRLPIGASNDPRFQESSRSTRR